MKKTIGILGGMGPEATAYFYNTIIARTKVETDQDHIPVIIYADPRVPPRTDAIRGRGEDPTPQLIKGAETLKAAGADFIVVPCITAHYFLPKVVDEVGIPFIWLLDESLVWAHAKISHLKRAGLLASSGTLDSRLFHDKYRSAGIDIVNPEEPAQRKVMQAIFGPLGIKAGFTDGTPRADIIREAKALIDRGAQAIIAGCTEIPLVLKDDDIPVPLIEPMRIAAEACIREAGFELKNGKEDS